MRKTIAGNIAKYRKQLGMTQIDLSEKINYSDKSISKWERGDGIPDVPTLVQLAEIFGVSVDELIYPPKPQPELPVEPESDAKSADSTYGRFRWKHFFITLLSVAGVWLVAFLMICLFQYLAPSMANLWDGRVLCYALAGSFVVFLIFCQPVVGTGMDFHCHNRHHLGRGSLCLCDIPHHFWCSSGVCTGWCAGTAGSTLLFLAVCGKSTSG